MNRDDERARGVQAKRLLDDPLLSEAFREIESRYTSVWRDSAPSQKGEREEAYSALFALKQLRQQLQNYLETGRLAAFIPEDQQE